MNKEKQTEIATSNYVFTDKEAAAFLRMSQTKLWRERRASRISFSRLGGRLVYTRADLETYLDRNRQPAICS